MVSVAPAKNPEPTTEMQVISMHSLLHTFRDLVRLFVQNLCVSIRSCWQLPLTLSAQQLSFSFLLPTPLSFSLMPFFWRHGARSPIVVISIKPGAEMYAMDAFPADFYRLIFHYYAKCSQGKCYAMRWEGKREEDIAERPKSETAQFTHNKCAKSGK